MSQHQRPFLSFDALMVKTGLDQATTSFDSQGGIRRIPAGQTYLAELIGVNIRTVARWAQFGVTLRGAEKACHALGLHPCEVWGDEWIDCVISVDA